jgi:hypothetical protein
VNFRLFGCGKYRRLMNEKFDRALSLRERGFMAQHRSVCTECRREETQGAFALNMLRLAAIEDEPMESGLMFEERVLRRWRVQSTRESVRYWSPAFAGAAIAGLMVLAALQLVSGRPGIPSTSNPSGAVHLQSDPRLPEIDLDKIERMR